MATTRCISGSFSVLMVSLLVFLGPAGPSMAEAGHRAADLDQMIAKVRSLRGSVVVLHDGIGLGKGAEEAQVVEVRLPEHRMTDAQLEKIGRIETLEHLDLTANEFTIGEVPDDVIQWLGTLPRLMLIGAQGSLVTDAGVEHLAQLSNLKSLSLSGSQITDRSFITIEQLRDLESLRVGQAPLERREKHYFRGHLVTDEAMKKLHSLPHLRDLSLYATHITDHGIATIARSTSLVRLDLGHTQVSDASADHLSTMSGLQSLNLEGTRVGDRGLAKIAKLSALRELGLDYTNVSDASAAAFMKLPWLERVGLQRTGVGDVTVAALRTAHGLREIDLGFTKISDASLHSLSSARDLRRLYLDGTLVGDPGLAELVGLSRLEELDLNHTAVTSEGMVHVSKLSRLRSLGVAATKVGATGLESISGLTQLRELDLSETVLTEKGLRALSGLDLLRLFVDDTDLDDTGLASIGRMTRLVELSMNRTAITGAGFRHLEPLRALRTLYFGETAVDDEAAKTIGKMKHLRIFGATGVVGMTDKSIERLRGLRNIHTMELAFTSVTDAAIPMLENFSTMHCYDLAGSRVTAEGIAGLSAYANVHSFALDGVQASATGLRNAKNGMAFFDELYLYGPDVDDEFLARSSGLLSGLRELSLLGTAVTDVGLAHLESVTSLVALRLVATEVSPEAVDRLRRAVPNLTISIQRETGWLFVKPWGDASEVTVVP